MITISQAGPVVRSRLNFVRISCAFSDSSIKILAEVRASWEVCYCGALQDQDYEGFIGNAALLSSTTVSGSRFKAEVG